MTTTLVKFKENVFAATNDGEFALPSNVKPEAFRNAALIAAQDNPKILQCDQPSVFKSLRTLATAGLVPDGREAALVPFNTKIDGKWGSKCQAMPMVFGLIKMVRRSGEVSDIRAHIVYQNEVDQGRFDYVVGDDESLTHKPILFGEKGNPVAAYAIAKMKDGTTVREFMSAEEIETVRRSSAAQKDYSTKPAKTSEKPIGIWLDWWAEMWKKTVIRRICKRLDMSSEDMRRVLVDEDTEMKDVTPDAPELSAFAEKIAAARAEAEPQEPEEPQDPAPEDEQPHVEDAEIIPDEEPAPETPKKEPKAEPAEHWTVGVDTDGSFPGSEAWDEGVKAHTAGMKRTMCPHQDDQGQAADWLGGYDEAGKE